MSIKANLRARQRRRRILWISVLAVVVALIVVAYLVSVATTNPNLKYIGEPVSSSVIQDLTGVSDNTLAAVGTPSVATPPVLVSGSALTSGGKPEIVYIGGEFCPYCAVERWSLIVALSKFGNFSGLQYMLSSSTDINPDSPTFTFASSTYTSNYVAFVGVEEYGRAGQTDVIQALTTDQSSLVAQFDTCSATGSSGGIPFVDIANQYAVNCGSQFNPVCPGTLCIAGDNWTQISSQLNNPNNPITQAIDGAANYLITAICNVDGSKPSSVCGQPFATETLAFSQPPGSAPAPYLAIPSRFLD